MVDIHSHILANIDDGSHSLEESVQIVKTARENGVTDIVVTPHFILGSDYNKDNKVKKEKLRELQNSLNNEKIDVNLYLGNEVFIENDMLSLFLDGKIASINGSRYLLIELPRYNEVQGLANLIFQLRDSGIVPIIAHPERYAFLKKDIQRIVPLLEQGVLFQGNIGSLYDEYGAEAKKILITLLQHNAIHFLASDVHHSEHNSYQYLPNLKKVLKKYLSEEQIEKILISNPIKIISDQEIREEFIPFTKKRFFFSK